GLAQLEQHLARIGELVLHAEAHIHQVDVGSEHPGLEIAAVDAGDVDLVERLDGPRPAHAQPRRLDGHEFPEPQDHATLGGLDLEDAAPEPQGNDDGHDDQGELAALAAGPQQLVQAALPALHALIEVRAPLTGTPAPWTVVLTARLIPCHRATQVRPSK